MTSLEEQQAIVIILNNILDKEQQAKETAQSPSDRIGIMKKAVLTRVFRSGLGTNNPDDESAVELLRRKEK